MTPPTVQFIPAGGLSLIIHDAMSGSGSIVGRTPDTADNGNTWEVPESDTTITISSGDLIRTATGGSSPDPFVDACRIDIGTSSDFRLEAIGTTLAGGQTQTIGFSLFNTDGSTANSETHLVARLNQYGAMDMFDIASGVVQQQASDRPSASITAPNGTLLGLRAEYDGTYVTFSVWNSSFTTEYASITSADFTGGNFTTTPSVKNGLHFGGTTTPSSTRYTDFKAYA